MTVFENNYEGEADRGHLGTEGYNMRQLITGLALTPASVFSAVVLDS